MSLSDLASLGSFVSGVAVLFTFVFLALQLRQSNVQLQHSNVNQRASIQAERTARGVDQIYRRFTDPRLIDITMRGRKGDPSMLQNDVESYLRMNYALFMSFEDTYLQHSLGTIDPNAWPDAVARLKAFLVAPGARVSWKKLRPNFRSDFAQAIDQIVIEARLSSYEEPATSWASDVAEEMRLSAK